MKLRVTLTKRRFYEAEQIYRCLFTPKCVGVLLNACIGKCWTGRQRLAARQPSKFSYEQQGIRQLKCPVVGRSRTRMGSRGRTPATAARISSYRQIQAKSRQTKSQWGKREDKCLTEIPSD